MPHSQRIYLAPTTTSGFSKNHEAGKKRPNFAFIAVLLTGPTALIVLPVFLLSGYTLVQSVPITILVQFAVFLGVLGIGLCRSPGVAKTHETATLTQDVNLPDCKIWPACTDNEDGHPPPCVALIASAGNQSRQIAVDLAQQGYSAYQTQDADAMLKAVLACAPEWDFLIFDLDLTDDLDQCVDELVAFRKACPKIPILLLSGSVQQDEFSDHRRAIGDATLRKPIARNRLFTGIEAMRENSAARGGI
ncbi:MAG: hypothetical protein HLUCCA05_10710 [Roseibaca calidilacus]|uniref:Response regulatory domain-containing protein n=2 Tax=Roseibaca calidilacus TaxID=1666912 RepID=A0A0N8K7W3_9RHOB|nr:MAG: hypothetical protein HLUCCA05_10710 [Roseibaca calidilacus]CUX80071.1 hypothetical protein Ga0058931_0776 [Roseibaca calidilacus]